MGSVINPIFQSLVPISGLSPKGSPVPGGSSSGSNSFLPNVAPGMNASGVTNNSYAGSVVPGASSPTAMTTPTPAFPANGPAGATTPFGQGSSGFGSGINSTFAGFNPDQWNSLFKSLKGAFGFDGAKALVTFLEGGAGFNPQALQALFAQLQPQINRGTESIMEQFSAMGNRFGSPAATGLGDFLSQVNLNEGQIAAQMYETAIQDFLQVLMGGENIVAKNKANSPSIFDSILGGVGLAGAGAQGATAGLASAAGGAGGIEAILAGLAAI